MSNQNQLEEKSVPVAALAFTDDRSSVKFLDAGADQSIKTPKLEMIAYSGGVIRNHFWWGNLAIDLAGVQFPKDRYPILEEHWEDKKIAHVGKPSVQEGMGIVIAGEDAVFVDTPASHEFRRLAKDGFPYQASFYGEPMKIEELEPGATAEVNGYTLEGPGTIWREWIFKEASVCTFGYDPNTSSAVFAKRGGETKLSYRRSAGGGFMNKKKGTTGQDPHRTMTFQEAISDPAVVEAVKEQVVPEVKEEVKAEIVEEVKAEVKAEVVEEVKAEIAGEAEITMAEGEDPPAKEDKPEEKSRTIEEARSLLQEILGEYPELADEISKADGEDEKMSAMKSETKKLKHQIAALEKKMAMQSVQDAKETSKAIMDMALEASVIPAKFHEKVRKQVRFSEFMKDGSLDKAKFKVAVAKEIGEWEEGFGDSIVGQTFASREPDRSDDESDKMADRMFSIVNRRKQAS